MVKGRRKTEKDSLYVLKLVLFFLLGAFWLRIGNTQDILMLPVGFIAGIMFARHEHFQIDRKIEYAVLLVAMVLSAYIPVVGFWV